MFHAGQTDLKPAELTREQLLDAAEKLFLERGLDEVSLRAIGREAGTRNQSALQYHFGNREGLIGAILKRRMGQLEKRRSRLVDELLARQPEPPLREICGVLVRVPFLLCRESLEFRVFLGKFGQKLLASDRELALAVENPNLPSMMKIRPILYTALNSVDPEILRLRAENVASLVLLAISQRARRGGSFRGRQAELFFNNLVDQIAAMLAAPPSAVTLAQLHAG